MADYKAPIGGLTASLLLLAFRLASAFTGRITHTSSRQIVNGLVTSVTDLIKALSDANPDDEAQVKLIVNKMLSAGDFHEGSKAALITNIAKIKDEPVKQTLLVIVNQVYLVGAMLSDQVEPNGAQVKAHLRGFLQSPDGVEFFVNLVDIALDSQTAAIVGVILAEALLGVFREQGILDQINLLKSKYETELLS